MMRNMRAREIAQKMDAEPPVPSPRLTRSFRFGCAGQIWSVVVSFGVDGSIERVVPASRGDDSGAFPGWIGDICALVSVLLSYDVPLDCIADAVREEQASPRSGDAALADALVEFLLDLARIEGPVVRSMYLTSEYSRLSAVDAETAR